QLALATHDPDRERQVITYATSYSWCRFATPQAACAWVAAHQNETGEDASLGCMTTWAARAKDDATRTEAMNDLAAIRYPLRRNPTLIEAGKKLGFVELLTQGIDDPNVGYDALGYAYCMLAELDPVAYPSEGLTTFLAKYDDRRAAQEAAERAAARERIL